MKGQLKKGSGCPLCVSDERTVIERLLSKGEPISYLMERFPGLNDAMIRSHRDLHMEPLQSTEFASPQNILWDLQETRQRLLGLIDWSLQDKKNPKPGITLQAINSLVFVLRDMGARRDEVIKIEAGIDGALYQDVIREVLGDKPDVMKQFADVLRRRLLTLEEQ